MANLVKIRRHMWATQSVGISVKHLNDDVLVEILYTTKAGHRPWPGKYFMARHRAQGYPTMKVKGMTLHIIPISDFEDVSQCITPGSLSVCCGSYIQMKLADDFSTRFQCSTCGQVCDEPAPVDSQPMVGTGLKRPEMQKNFGRKPLQMARPAGAYRKVMI